MKPASGMDYKNTWTTLQRSETMMMRDLRWEDRPPESQLVRVWLVHSDEFPLPDFVVLASSLHLFDAIGIRRVEVL